MFHQYDPNVRATIAFLKLINVRVNNTTVNETLQNHPDWPSMLCITDSLSKWKIPNGAGKIDVTDIDQLPTPFIAYTYERETPLAIVTQVTGANVLVRQKNYSNLITETREEFFKKWNGVYLLAESNEHSGEINYEAKKSIVQLSHTCCCICSIDNSFSSAYSQYCNRNKYFNSFFSYILLFAISHFTQRCYCYSPFALVRNG